MLDELLKSLPVVLPVLVSVAGALGGVYLGALLYRRTQHGSWLVQKRAEHYEKFWLAYKEAFDGVSGYRYSDDLKMDDFDARQRKIRRWYDPFSKELYITRLYASDLVKGHVEKLDNQLSQWCSIVWSHNNSGAPVPMAQRVNSGTKEATALINLRNLEQRLQEAFERELKKM
jgi:hypothetical protein